MAGAGRRSWLVEPAAWLAVVWLLGRVAAPAGELPATGDRWVEASTPHFLLFGNAAEATVRRVAADLERLRAVLGQLFDDDLDAPVPTWVYVFKSDASFRPYKPRYQGKPAELAGYFHTDRDGNYVALDGSIGPGGERDPSDILYHEYLHQVLHGHYPELPAWLDEGLAEFYSTFAVEGEEAVIGRPIAAHIHWLRRNPMLPLPELVAIDHRSKDYHEGHRRGVFYAQSWALVHYLYVGNPERRGQAAGYARLLREGQAADAAFVASFGGGFADLEKELRQYVRGPTFQFVKVPIAAADNLTVAMRPLQRHETLTRLGDLLAHAVPTAREAAGEYFRTALEAAPDHAPAHAGLGFLRQADGDLEGALGHYRRAAAATPADPLVGFRLGSLEIQRIATGAAGAGGLDAEAQARLEAALEALTRCVAVRPDLAEAWARLGYGYTLLADPPPEALEALERAHRLLPAREDVTHNLALLHGRKGSKVRARQLLRDLLRAAVEPQEVERARSALVRFEIHAAHDLHDEGRHEEALAGLERFRPSVVDPVFLGQVDAALEGICRAAGEKRFAERYNEGVRLAGSGQLDRAIAIVEELLAGAETDEHREAAQGFLERLRRARRR